MLRRRHLVTIDMVRLYERAINTRAKTYSNEDQPVEEKASRTMSRRLSDIEVRFRGRARDRNQSQLMWKSQSPNLRRILGGERTLKSTVACYICTQVWLMCLPESF